MRPKKICARCIYDEDVPAISFNEQGICSYCQTHDQLEKEYPIGVEGKQKLDELVREIKNSGKNGQYDCVVGVSGGCDSSYLLYQMKEYGLRPLAVHFDNTWNSTISTGNIRNLLKKLKVDLYTHVVNNKEYDDIYRSFLKAGVPDIEAPTDIGLAATLCMAAEKYGIKYIIEGHSFRTEGISPLGWLYMDAKYIETVQKMYGSYPLKTFPNLWLSSQLNWMVIKGIKKVRPLYYMEYDKEKVKEFLSREFDWQWYGGHHLENRFTAFYHQYFLPMRFGIDARLLGYCALMRSGQMTREEGLELMSKRPYESPDALEIVELVKKRLGYSNEEFIRIMNAPKRTYKEFKTYKRTFERMRPFFWLMYKLELIPKSFYMKFTAKDKN
ncbi:MAG: N-acetyl sugar amidotransferase [Gammaproteobacteria bacterium]